MPIKFWFSIAHRRHFLRCWPACQHMNFLDSKDLPMHAETGCKKVVCPAGSADITPFNSLLRRGKNGMLIDSLSNVWFLCWLINESIMKSSE